ncbi:hypothetical protein N8349_03630 [Gammaproteobacteria bacterium]|nr:hypothetical protein [Gammaproteobacteria bacterium]
MKNLLLILPLLFAPSLDASTKIDIITYDSDTRISVYCIGGYAFTSVRSTSNGESALTQIMRQSPETSNKSHMTPMTCKEYMASKPVELW